MLYQRILTAAVALPITVAAILFLPTWGIATVVAVLMLFAAWEWGGLMALSTAGRSVFVVLVAACLMLLGGLRDSTGMVTPDVAVIAVASLFWLLVIGQLARFPRGWHHLLGRRPLAGIVGCIVLSAPVAALAYIHQSDHGPSLVLLLCVMVWGADTGAYAAGRTLGRRKLLVNVSPGKTVEGALGGVAAAMLTGAAGAFLLGLPSMRILAFIVLGAWIALISIVGDLTISMFKRQAGLKDSGFLFPGHGGVLDRLDSLTAAAPWFVVGLLLMR
ncbi:phosphatidate cytidylyltransferase [Salinisphaera sp. Q1T1-3]|uniref:phosphatidate cytidylyltransferase n=1 Tax=Salinisphaera sp. Q1T1-3 TaxID=2321229 RepID=UPI000E734CB3|nr:phosphatidate cytidylyltransferase [Salinisphaera sp. Q1T1-3]RJS95336.1 hypothetical protein D3260_01975 [Salinisphaera sp. Q1T1-3]